MHDQNNVQIGVKYTSEFPDGYELELLQKGGVRIMKLRPPKPHQVCTVGVEHNDKIHSASYTIESGVVIVRYGIATNRGIPTNPASHLLEAKRLLREILEGGKWMF